MFCLNRPIILQHWGRDEIDNIALTTFLKVFSSMKVLEFIKKKSLKFVGTTNNIVALVQIIAWRRPSDTLSL